MGVASSVKLLGAAIVWRTADVRPAGRALVEGLTGDEQERTLAGMGLVQAGERSVSLIESEVATGEASKMMVRVLEDIGGSEAGRVLELIAAGSSEAAELAREAVNRPQPPD